MVFLFQIPMEFYRQLNNITDISEFIEKFIDPDSIDPQLGIHGNIILKSNFLNKTNYFISFFFVFHFIFLSFTENIKRNVERGKFFF